MQRSEIGKKAQELYDTVIRPQVESGNVGRYLMIDVISGDYEVGDEYLHLGDSLRARHPEPELFLMRIRHQAVGYMRSPRPVKRVTYNT